MDTQMVYKRMVTLRNVSYKLIRIALLIILSITVYYIVSDMVGEQLCENITPVRGMLFGKKKIVLFSMVVIIVLLYFCNWFLKKVSMWNRTIEVIILSLYFALCLFFSYYFANKGVFEIGVVDDISNSILWGGQCDYYTLDFMSRYSYLRSLACFSTVFSICGEKIKALYVCLGMTMGLFSSLELLKMIGYTPRTLMMTTLFFYTSVPLYLSCSIFYNYTVVFWIPITIITLYYMIMLGDGRISLYISLISICVIGVCIFSIVWVPIIAMAIDMILNRKYKSILTIFIIIILSAFLNSAAYHLIDNKIYNTPELRSMCEKNEIPMFASTLYTGLNDDSIGFYTNDDLIHILELPSYEEKLAFLKRENINRIKEKKGKIVDFTFKKSSLTFGHGTFNTEAVSNHGLLKERGVIKYFSNDFEEVRFYRSFYCALNVIMLVLIVIGIVAKKEINDNNILYLTILGFWMVSMISETDSRHMLPCLPLLFVLAAQTIADIAEGKIILLDSKDLD